jgi:hypothetical protein
MVRVSASDAFFLRRNTPLKLNLGFNIKYLFLDSLVDTMWIKATTVATHSRKIINQCS